MTGKELKSARISLGRTQKAMGELIGTSRRNWQDWEYGVTPCPGPVACLIRLLLHYKGAAAWLERVNKEHKT